MSPTDYSQTPTPERCYVDFCLIPVGRAHDVSSGEHRALTAHQPDRHRQRVRRKRSGRGAEASQGQRAVVHDALGGDDSG